MVAFLAELLVDLVRSLVGNWLKETVLAAGTWLEARIPGRKARIVAGLLLGLLAFILIPVVTGLLGL